MLIVRRHSPCHLSAAPYFSGATSNDSFSLTKVPIDTLVPQSRSFSGYQPGTITGVGHTVTMAERLWAPWRYTYIKAARAGEAECIFVDLPAQTDDRKNLILHRGEGAFVMLNAYPYTNGHLMVAPYRHTTDFDELSDGEHLEIQRLLAAAIGWLKGAYRPDGFNIGVNLGRVAGAGIEDHLHWHIVPRWSGDTNFMPVIGEVRVLPQSLEESYDLLRREVERWLQPSGQKP